MKILQRIQERSFLTVLLTIVYRREKYFRLKIQLVVERRYNRVRVTGNGTTE